jgi:hypothetical protein
MTAESGGDATGTATGTDRLFCQHASGKWIWLENWIIRVEAMPEFVTAAYH